MIKFFKIETKLFLKEIVIDTETIKDTIIDKNKDTKINIQMPFRPSGAFYLPNLLLTSRWIRRVPSFEPVPSAVLNAP